MTKPKTKSKLSEIVSKTLDSHTDRIFNVAITANLLYGSFYLAIANVENLVDGVHKKISYTDSFLVHANNYLDKIGPELVNYVNQCTSVLGGSQTVTYLAVFNFSVAGFLIFDKYLVRYFRKDIKN